jgi:hypothetical protein
MVTIPDGNEDHASVQGTLEAFTGRITLAGYRGTTGGRRSSAHQKI